MIGMFRQAILFSLLSVCSFAAEGQPEKPAAAYQGHYQQGNITVVAFPIRDKKQVEKELHKSLAKLSLVPVKLIVTNEGADDVLIEGEPARLIDSFGDRYRPLSGEELFELVAKMERGRSGPPVRIGIPLPGGSKAAERLGQVRRLLDQVLLASSVAPRGETRAFFLFFKIPNEKGHFEGAHLYLPELRNMRTGEELMFLEFALAKPPGRG